jgi:hypothetical protein
MHNISDALGAWPSHKSRGSPHWRRGKLNPGRSKRLHDLRSTDSVAFSCRALFQLPWLCHFSRAQERRWRAVQIVGNRGADRWYFYEVPEADICCGPVLIGLRLFNRCAIDLQVRPYDCLVPFSTKAATTTSGGDLTDGDRLSWWQPGGNGRWCFFRFCTLFGRCSLGAHRRSRTTARGHGTLNPALVHAGRKTALCAKCLLGTVAESEDLSFQRCWKLSGDFQHLSQLTATYRSAAAPMAITPSSHDVGAQTGKNIARTTSQTFEKQTVALDEHSVRSVTSPAPQGSWKYTRLASIYGNSRCSGSSQGCHGHWWQDIMAGRAWGDAVKRSGRKPRVRAGAARRHGENGDRL